MNTYDIRDSCINSWSAIAPVQSALPAMFASCSSLGILSLIFPVLLLMKPRPRPAAQSVEPFAQSLVGHPIPPFDHSVLLLAVLSGFELALFQPWWPVGHASLS